MFTMDSVGDSNTVKVCMVGDPGVGKVCNDNNTSNY